MFTSGRSEMVTRIVGDINSTLVRKLEDLEHRVLMRIENLQRYEEQTMGALTARVDALERTSSSLRFQNEMIQDELDELERLLLREYAQDEVTRTISTSCQNLTDTSSPKSGPKHTATGFAKNFGQRILNDQRKKEHKKTLLKRFTENFTTKVAAERSDMLNRAAIIAQGCGSPMMINNRKKLLKAFVLHIAARILTEQKRVIEKAREAKEGSAHGRVVKMNKLNAALTQEFVKKYMNRETAGASSPHTRSRCYSDHGSVYDLNQFAYPGKGSSKRLFSRPLQRISPEPGPFNPLNVQRMPYSPLFRAKSTSPERFSEQKGAKYRFPGIKRYASLKKGNLIDLDNN